MYILGIIDKLMKEIENRVFLSKKSGLKFMDSFLKKVIISYIEIQFLFGT